MTVTYADEEYAENYFLFERLNSESWSESTDLNKRKALLEGTRRIDRLNFQGAKTYYGQDLEFPRNGSFEIPDDILKANCEIAINFLDGVDPEMEAQNLATSTFSYATIRVTYDANIVREATLAGIPSILAWHYLKPYLTDPAIITRRRV